MRLLMRKITVSLLILLMGVVVIGQNGKSGFNLENLDRTCEPCKDFYQFANGGWEGKNPVPAAFSRWGSFNILQEKNRDAMRQILEDSAKNTNSKNGTEQRLGGFYASCMNEEQIESAGFKPLQPEFDRIEKIRDPRGLQATVARLQGMGVGALFGIGSYPDPKNTKEVIGNLVPTGLGLPDRDYYLKKDEKSVALREEYLKHMAKMFELAGEDAERAAASVKAVMALETALAEVSMTVVERRDPVKTYNKMELSRLKELTPNFAWDEYFKNIGAPQMDSINVSQPDYFKAADKLLVSVPLADWKAYLRWQLLTTAAPGLSSKFVEENFNFYGRTLTGAKEMLPRWRRCVVSADANLGEALGQLYVQKNFRPEDKVRMQEMVKNLVAAFRNNLLAIDWMSDETRKQALAKLDAFGRKIGYPDKWRDYSSLKIKRTSYAENLLSAAQFEFARNLRQIGQPVDRTEWLMTTPSVNAYYFSLFNEIVFPAGILQPPFFNPQADDAINYGAIGAVIGHEITHGFDDKGSQYDAQGLLRNWWAAEDLSRFKDKASCVIKQFSGYEVEEGLFMKGELVVGESIADLGGLSMAYAAYQKSLEGKPRPQNVDGFTPEQRFFLGWAQVWASNYRPEAARLQANLGPHPLARFRVNGPLSNMPQFAEAFNCKQGDPMVRPASDRCQVW